MKKLLFICLLIIACTSTAKAQWGWNYNPYLIEQQARQAFQQMQQEAWSQPYYATPNDFSPNVAPSTPAHNDQPAKSDYSERRRDNLNRVAGEACPSCHGTGKCPTCNGTKVAHSMGNTYPCNVCDANGNCPTCHGTGKTSWNR